MTRNRQKINWRTRKTRLVFPYSPSKHVTKGPSLRGLGYFITCSLWNTLYVKLITSIEKRWIKIDEPILHCNNRCKWELNWSGLFSSNCSANSCFSFPVWFELIFFYHTKRKYVHFLSVTIIMRHPQRLLNTPNIDLM